MIYINIYLSLSIYLFFFSGVYPGGSEELRLHVQGRDEGARHGRRRGVPEHNIFNEGKIRVLDNVRLLLI